MKCTFRQALTTLALALAAQAVYAAPVVVDFEDILPLITHTLTPVSSRGYTLTPVAGETAVILAGTNCFNTCASNGTMTFAAGGTTLNPMDVAPMTLTNDGALSFFLSGLDFAEFNNFPGANATSIVLTGNKFGGGTVTQTLAVDGLNDGPGGSDDFQSAALSAFWATTLLTSLEFTGFAGTLGNQAFQLDNIVVCTTDCVTSVPEPGTLALLGLGLAGLAGMRRKA